MCSVREILVFYHRQQTRKYSSKFLAFQGKLMIISGKGFYDVVLRF